MKLLRFGEKGAEKPGILDADGQMRDLSSRINDLSSQFLASGGLEKLLKTDLSAIPLVKTPVRLGPPVTGVGKILCIGLNYIQHIAETASGKPAEPMLFQKATSAINGPCDAVIIPRGSVRTDWEAELGVVIGKTAKYVEARHALDYVAGFTIVNDVSERDFQKNRAGQFTKGKSCDTFAPLGPWLVTCDEIADVQQLDVRTWVNDVLCQDGNTRDMIHGVGDLVSYLSQFMSLYPGDIIATGTPAGVGAGMKPPRFLKAGDRVRITIEGLGEQSSLLVDDSAGQERV